MTEEGADVEGGNAAGGGGEGVRGGEADPADLVRAYYDAIDDGDYDALRDVLAPEFTHVRPDMTLDGREAFVDFMCEDRPQPDTRHVVDAVYDGRDGVAARGRVLDAEGELFAFVDVFEVGALRIERLETYANSVSTRGSTSSS
jgi:ketosteroid isomerase-like protein